MIQRRDIQETIYKYIAKQMNCGIQDLHAGETIFIENDNKPEKYIKILSIEDTNIITLSSDLFSDGMRQLCGKSRDELYESNYVFGQTLHYVPDINQMKLLPFAEGYTFELLIDDDIIALAGASFVNHEMREVGIDVKKAFRGKKLASLLVHNLTVEILKQGKIPFYSASVTNIASQAVAIRSGYMPLWTDTFGVREIV